MDTKPLDYPFQKWLRKALPGATYTYHRGYLLLDRWTTAVVPGVGLVPGVFAEPVTTIANAAYRAWREGLVWLFQRRRGPGQYDYIAMRRK